MMFWARSLILSSAVILVLSCTASGGDGQNFEQIERGRYLSALSDCDGCHTAARELPFAGGVRLQTPFGVLATPNITPDSDTGIGDWSDDDFVSAVRFGRGRNGVRLYPAMPYPAYSKMSRDDVLAIRAYLSTISPVKRRIIVNQLSFPFSVRLSLLFWNWLNFKPEPLVARSDKSDEWNRGAYIVQGPGHCGACHTPKNFLGADKAGRALEGAALQGWFAPNITGDRKKGIGGWSQTDVVQYLKTGTNTRTLASGPMAEAITHSTSQMSDTDLAAIATYLLSLDPKEPHLDPAVASNDSAMKAGAAIYKEACSACHKDDGSGEPRLFPRLAESALVQSDDPITLIRIVLHGSRAVATSTAPTAPAMPGFDWRLDSSQVAAVLTFIRNSWGNSARPVSSTEVNRLSATISAKSP